MGIFPYCFKHAIFKSLYKMEDQSRVMNYRPIHYGQQFQRHWRELCVTEYTINHKFIKRKADIIVCVYQETGQAEKTE